MTVFDIEMAYGAYRFWLRPSSAPDLKDGMVNGQKYNAKTVNVVSIELDNVLVEQNHCHGLIIVRIS